MLFLFSVMALSVETPWPWKEEKCKFGFYFSICVDLVFRKEAEPYKGTGPCQDRWQTDCQVKTVSARVISADWTPLAVQLLFCTLGDTQPLIPSSVFRDKPSGANRLLIHSFRATKDFFCTGFCLDPIVPQTWGQPEKGSWSGRELPWDV